MNILVQSFLNSAITLTIVADPSTAVETLKASINTAEGVDTAIMELYYKGTLLVDGHTLSDYNIQANSYINSSNTISSLATKELRQKAKLDLAALKRATNGQARATYDITQLPTQYDDNGIIDNANTGGLVLGRPWITGP